VDKRNAAAGIFPSVIALSVETAAIRKNGLDLARSFKTEVEVWTSTESAPAHFFTPTQELRSWGGGAGGDGRSVIRLGRLEE
jgi:hypothetical protein